MSVDLVIVNLNGKSYLRDCLASIVRNTQSAKYRLVVVDNGSIDGSKRLLRSEFPSAHLIANSSNLGFATACNQGIGASRGEFILLLNNDTLFLNDVIGRLQQFLLNNEGVGLVGPQVLFPDGRLQYTARRFPTAAKFILQLVGIPRLMRIRTNVYFPYGPVPAETMERTCPVDWLSGACIMFRRSLYESLGPLDDRMPFGMEDVDYAYRAQKAGYRNWYVHSARLIHVKGGSHLAHKVPHVRDQVLEAYERGAKLYFRKHHSIIEYFLIATAFVFRRVIRRIESWVH